MGNIYFELRSHRPPTVPSEEIIRGKESLSLSEVLSQLGARATQQAALAARQEITRTYGNLDFLPAEEIAELKVRLDQAAVDAMRMVFDAEEDCGVVSVGSEGAKEVLHAGVAAPSLKGAFATHASVFADCVSDPVEGTTAAANRLPGAVSVVAFSERNGLLASKEETYYMEKLFAPAQLQGVVSLDTSPEENITAALAHLRIAPEKLRVVILNRSRNSVHIEAARKLGVNLILIEAGDLMPGLLAVTGQGGPVLQMGSGGYEEGVIVAAAAKARGAVGEGRVLSKEGESPQPILRLNDLVPGAKEHCVVAVTGITADPWFGLGGSMVIGRNKPRIVGETLVISAAGVTHEHPKYFR